MTIENRSGLDSGTSGLQWADEAGTGAGETQSPPGLSVAANESKEVAQTVADAGMNVAHEATAQVSAVAGQAKEQLGVVVGQAKDELRSQLDTRAHQAAEGLRTIADQLGALLQGRPQDAGHVATLVGEAHHRVQAYSRTLAERGPQAMIDDLAVFARRRPVRFLFGAAIAGLAAGRLARSGVAVAHDSSVAPGSPASAGGSPMAAVGGSGGWSGSGAVGGSGGVVGLGLG